MRAPLASILFFIAQIRTIIAAHAHIDEITKALRYLQISEAQIMLMQTFVNDLLDFRMLKESVFSLLKEPFDPANTLDLICEIFRPVAEAKGVEITWKHAENDLQLLQQ